MSETETEAGNLSCALREAADAGDSARFDAIAESATRAPLALLLETVPDAQRARVAALLPARGQPGGMLDPLPVRLLVPEAALGLWLATEWALDVLPHERRAPSPPHEQWDALLELHRDRAEAPWLLAAVFAALSRDQPALGRRARIGVDRRFGARGWRVLRHVAGASPLASLLAP